MGKIDAPEREREREFHRCANGWTIAVIAAAAKTFLGRT